MADDGQSLNFRITAESGIFNSEIKKAASTAKDASSTISFALAAASEAADKLNRADATRFISKLTEAGSISKAEAEQITKSMGLAATSVTNLNKVSTSGFQSQVRAAAQASADASNKMLDAETRRAAIAGRMRAQQGPDRNTETFKSASAVTSQDFLQSQNRGVRNAFVTQQRELNIAISTGAETSQRASTAAALQAEVMARAGAAADREAASLQHLNAALGITAAGTEAATGASRLHAAAEEAEGHAAGNGIPDRVKADFALRALNGDLFTGVRAAGAFAASISGIEPLLAGAFTAIGAVALVGTMVELGKKAFEATRDFVELHSAIDAIKSEQITVDVKLKADKSAMEQSLEKIIEDNYSTSKNPNLGKAMAMRQRLSYQQQQGTDLSEYFQSSPYTGLADNVKGSGDKSYETQYKQISADALPDRLRQVTTEANQLREALQQGQDNGGVFRTNIAGRGPKTGQDPEAYLKARLLVAQQIQQQLSSASQVRDYSIQQTQSDIGKDQRDAAATSAQQAAEAANKATEAVRKANEAQLQAFQEGAVAIESAQTVDVAKLYDYWASKANAFKNAPTEALAVARATNAAFRRVMTENNSILGSALTTPGGILPDIRGFYGQQVTRTEPNQEPARVQPQDLSKDSEAERDIASDGGAAERNLLTLSAMTDAQQKQAFAVRQASIEMKAANGELSRYSIAQQTAKLHTDEYTEASSKLDDELAVATKNKEASPTNENISAVSALTLQKQQLDDARSLQTVSDSAIIDDTGLQAQWRNSLNHFVQQSQDAGKQIGSIFTDSLGSVNGSLATALTGQYHTSRERMRALRSGLGDDARGAATKVANYGLQNAEGAGLKALGFGGKADGSQGNPLWVRIAAGLGVGAGGAGGGLAGALGIDGSAPGASVMASGGSALSRLLGRTTTGANTISQAMKTGPASGSGYGDLASSAVTSAIPLQKLQGFFGDSVDADDDDDNDSTKPDNGIAALGSKLFGSDSGFGSSNSAVAASSSTSTEAASGFNRGLGGVLGGVSSGLDKIGTGLIGSGISKKLFGSDFQGFFASGGDVVANRPSIIGEKGPEAFIPRTAGTIIPNNQLNSFGSTTHHMPIHVDARGSSDPAAIEAAAHRAVMRATPQIMAATLHLGSEQRKRRPASAS